MPRQPLDALAGRNVPVHDDAVLAGGGERAAVGGKGERVDGASVAGEDADSVAGLDVPEANAVVGGAGGNVVGVGVEAHDLVKGRAEKGRKKSGNERESGQK